MTMVGGAARALKRAAVWLTLLAALALLLVMVVVPRLGGGASYTVLTGSMEPSLPPGTLIVVTPEPFDQIDIGEVVTYQLESGKRPVVTHRVIGRTFDLEGRPALITQGDANNAPDPELVIKEQVRGTVWYSVPVLGRLNIAAVEQRALLARVVAGGLFVYAAWMVIAMRRDRGDRSEPRPPARRKVSA